MTEETQVEQLTRELAALQSRRGVQQLHRDDAVGVLVTQALSLERHREGQARRNALIKGLIEHAEDLPADLRFVFLTACAIRAEQRPSVTERLEYAGRQLGGLHVRTMWRRIDAANKLVAASLAGSLRTVDSSPRAEWVLTALHTSLDLTEPQPIFRSRHTLRVVSSSLSEFSERISFPGASPDAQPTFAVSGDCSLVRVARIYQVTWELTMATLRPFTCGQSVSYSFFIRAPSRRWVHPMTVMLPERECRTFSTEVNFGQPSVAARVWRLDGAPAPAAELDAPAGTLLSTEESPVLRAEYHDMKVGRVYGLRWDWADDGALAPR